MPADPVVSPADTIRHDYVMLRRDSDPSQFFRDDEGYYHARNCRGCKIAALLAVGERDKAEIEALRGCPAGNGCAINAGAIHCYHCRRNYPPDDTWEKAFLDRPDLRQGEIRTLHSILDEKLSAGERDRRQIARLTEALEAADTAINWHAERIVPTEDVPNEAEAHKVAGDMIAAVIADKEDARP